MFEVSKLIKPSIILVTLFSSLVFVGVVFNFLYSGDDYVVIFLCATSITFAFNNIFWIFNILKYLAGRPQLITIITNNKINLLTGLLITILLIVALFLIFGGIEEANKGSLLFNLSFIVGVVLANFIFGKSLWIMSKGILEIEATQNITKSMIFANMKGLVYFPFCAFSVYKRLSKIE